MGLTTGAELFHTPAGDAYATVPVGDHRETHPVRSKGFRQWLVRNYFERCARPPSAQALEDALGLLEARAQFDGAEREVHVRVAEHEGAIYVDLANAGWEAVEISAGGWRVVPSGATPVRFRRPRGMLPLPTPARGGRIEQLRRYINVGGDDPAGWRLLVAWLVQALRPAGPYPVLILLGEQGSAKSTAERLLRLLVDPSTAPLRTAPRNEHDLIIAANNSWCVAFDNISKLPPWCSDALCRLSTGGGFSARELIEVPLKRKEELAAIGARPIKGVLFTGPPGTGKTMLARIIANSAEARFYEISGPQVFSKWYGESEEILRRIFEHAASQERAIVFFDEIDSVAGQRAEESHEASRRVVAQLLTSMDGFSADDNVVVIAATNRPQDIDEALQRPGRFDWEIRFPWPDRADREEILQKGAERLSTRGELSHATVSDRTDGWSAAELSTIWSEAALLAASSGRSAIRDEDYVGGWERVADQRSRTALPPKGGSDT